MDDQMYTSILSPYTHRDKPIKDNVCKGSKMGVDILLDSHGTSTLKTTITAVMKQTEDDKN
jgi:hypothetical protein